MPSLRDDDLLFGVTTLQLRFLSAEQLAAATAEPHDASSLRQRLIQRGLLTPAEADAVAAVVAQRLARFDNDPQLAVESVAAAEAAVLAAPAARTRRDEESPAGRDGDGSDPFPTVPHQPLRVASGARFATLRPWQQGGLGRVSIAADRELHREIALKEILPQHADNEENRRRFVREAEVTGALEHPGVVPVYSLGEFPDGRPYYAMRFIQGSNLQAAIDDFFSAASAKPRYDSVEFRQLLGRYVDVCHTVHYAHSRGVLHRDLKPANIMLGDFGESIVVDWGLARLMGPGHDSLDVAAPPVSPSDRASGSYTQAGRVVGTPAYMSPEQAAGRLDLLGPASDIYGLGATLYHLLTGAPPFAGADDDLQRRVQQGQFRPPREIRRAAPAALEAICLRAMSRRPGDRYATAGELALDVERYLADEPVRAYSEPWPARLWRWIRNHRTLMMSGITSGAVALAALSAGIVLLSAANLRERAALDRAETNLVEAEEQRTRAERNFARARQAVQDYYVRVSEETLLNQPGMQPLRDALLRQALAYYEQFLDERGDDASLAREAAEAAYVAGRIAEKLGDRAAAAARYRQAIALAEDLPQPANRDDDAQQPPAALLARALNALGGVLQKQQRFDDARTFYERATELRKSLAAAAPDDAERARELANSLMNLGQLSAFQGRSDEALPLLKQAQAVRLAHQVASSVEFARDLGKGWYNVAIAQLQLNDASTAGESLLAAVEAFRRVAQLDPQDLDNVRRLSVAERLRADLLAQSGELDEAIEAYRAAVQPLRELTLRNPDVVEYAVDLAGVEMNLGQTLAVQGQRDAALSEIDRAIERLQSVIAANADEERPLRDLAVALKFAGEVLLDANQPAQAAIRLEAARDLLADLLSVHPEDPQVAEALHDAVRLLGEANAL
ncbi:MAG: hypothetical protein CMJ58_00435 [Planctomycetaceae bacterium]|nr:hypothetical protein [Planctomycetaceae bacterium]